jgi:pilus assembly protein CpaF
MSVRLVISNLLENTQHDVELSDRQYLIGRDLTSDIVLDNFFVSEKQAVLKYENQQIGILPIGSAPTLVNGETIPNNRTCLLNRQDEITIGQYVLQFRKHSAAGLSQGEDSISLAAHDLERNVHKELVDRLDLRKLDSGSMAPGEYRKKVEAVLEDVVSELASDVDTELIDYVTLQILKNALAVLHLSQEINENGHTGETDFSFNTPQFATYARKVYTIARKACSGVPNGQASLEDMESWADEHYGDVRYDLMPGTKGAVFHQYMKSNILDTVFGLGPLEPLLNLSNISEIMVVNPRLIYIEKNGQLQKTGRQFISDEIALSVIERIVAPLGLRVDRSTPIVDARLPDGSRVNIVIPPLALQGPCITIRKFSKIPLTMEQLVHEKNAISLQAAEFLRVCVVGGKNIIISGGTGAGKTTLLNCLSEYIPGSERIVTIEDSAEVQLKQEHVVSLESRPANVEGTGAYTIRDLVKNALRMRPDRIIVGECRGGEALDMLQAMNTGHDGSMTTGHANSPADMLRRIETMVLQGAKMPIDAIRAQIASGIDLVVQYTRFGDGARRITCVSEITKVDPETGAIIVEDIFQFQYSEGVSGGMLRPTGYLPSFFFDMMKRGGASLDLLFTAETADS